jgi:hypothetical protein
MRADTIFILPPLELYRGVGVVCGRGIVLARKSKATLESQPSIT